MSVFDDKGEPKPDEVTENFLDHLVGDGKKFDGPEALAKGKYEADLHVLRLETQLAEMRGDLDKATQLDEMMALLKESQEKELVPNTPKTPDDTSPGLSSDELKALIESTVSERDTKATRDRNLAEVDALMVQKFGDTAPRIISAKARELGMTNEELQAVAASNPKAFAQLVGANDTSRGDTGALVGGGQRGEVRPNNTSANKRNAAYYRDLRKTKRNYYYSPKVQMQMFKDREELGEEAFNQL